MRRHLVYALLFVSVSAHALQSLRVGSQVLVVGDSAARVKELLGEPVVHGRASGSRGGKTHNARRSAAKSSGKQRLVVDGKGETWQYRRDGHTTTFTIVDGKIARIQDKAR